MTDVKFLTEAQKCKELDKAEGLKNDHKKEKDQLSGNHKNNSESSRNGGKKRRTGNDNHNSNDCANAAGKDRFCMLCKLAVAPRWLYKNHSTRYCRKKEDYKRKLSRNVATCASATKDWDKQLNKTEKRYKKELRMLRRKVHIIEIFDE